MYNKLLKSCSKKIIKAKLAFAMAVIMIFSNSVNVFAFDVKDNNGNINNWSGLNFVYSISYNGAHEVRSTNANASVAQLDISKLTADYQSVPLDTTFTLTFNMGKVFLFRGSYDVGNNTFSKTTTNRDLIYIKDGSGRKVDATVSNQCDPNKTNVNDATVQVHPKNQLEYDTNYNLVVEKYITKSNSGGTLVDVTPVEVDIPFKTVTQQKPTLSKAELRGNSLRLEGLPVSQNLQYNLALDGQFDNTNWKAFAYTADTANIDVSNITLTANSKIMVGYTKNDGSVPTTISDPRSVLYASSSAPSFSSAVLDGNKLTLKGLPKNTTGLEYSISVDGSNFSAWSDLTVTDTNAIVDVSGLNMVQGTSIIQVRYKANPPSSVSEVSVKSFVYPLGKTVELTTSKPTIIDQGITINSVALNTPGAGEVNNVTVRNASGEKVPATLDGKTNMGFVEGDDDMVKSAGGIYGFSLKGADNNGSNNHVKITIPYELPTTKSADIPDYAVIDDSKVAIFMLTQIDFGNKTESWQYWQRLSTTIDKDKHTATVDITDFGNTGKDIILGVKYYVYPPANFQIEQYSRTSNSITLNIFQGSSVCGTKEVVLQRVNRDNPAEVKTVTLSCTDYPKLLNYYIDNWILYTDNDVKTGVNYEYTILSVTDMLGNKSCALDSTGKVVDNPSPPFDATVDSMETLVKETRDSIYDNLKELQKNLYYKPYIMFATDDSENSVTQKIALPTMGIRAYGSSDITWTSNRPDIIKIGKYGDTEVHCPVDIYGNPIKDGVTVTLTGIITYTTGSDAVTHKTETATGVVTIPLTIKWNTAGKEVIIGREFSHNSNMAVDSDINTDPTTDINTAAGFDDTIADTIVLKHSLILSDRSVTNDNSVTSAPADYVIDGQGKTIKADFDGALFMNNQNNSGSFTLKNAVIDMNHKSGPVLSAQSLGTKIKFDNVKIINTENCLYGVMLEAATSVNGSFSANNCVFPSFKIAAVSATTPAYSYSYYILDKTYTTKYLPVSISINNSTFDGGGNAGYGILDAFGNISVKNSIFKGYKGNLSTGWNTSNDSYNFPNSSQNPVDGDGNTYFPYKGIPDGSPSAAILVKEQGSLDINGNTITDSDSSILVWTGEKNFSFLWKKPDTNFVAYPTIKGVKVDSTTLAQVVNNMLSNNAITAESNDRNKVLVQDATDRYNRIVLMSNANAPWPGNYLVSQASFNGANSINSNSTTGLFDGNSISAAYENVPVDSIFTLTFNANKVFLFRGSWDPITGGFSSVLNRDLIQIQDAAGNVIKGITVSNSLDPGDTSSYDSTVKINTNNLLKYDTNYKLVVKKYFSKSNQQNPPAIKGAVPADVIIPFKTAAATPVVTSINISSPDSVELGTDTVTKAISAVVKDQFNNTITGKNITWSVVGAPIGVNINNEGLLTIKPFAAHGEITVKAAVNGTEIFSTKVLQIKIPEQTSILTNDIKAAITNAANSKEISLPASTSAVIAVDNEALQDIDAVNKPMILRGANKVRFQLKPKDLNLADKKLSDIHQLQIGSTAVDDATKDQLSSKDAISKLSGGSFGLATVPFKLSAIAILNNGNQQQITSFNNVITITVPAPSDMKLAANQTLRACRFNTETGVWEDRGEAALSEGNITFNTIGFSYWTVMVKTVDSSNITSNNATTNSTTSSNSTSSNTSSSSTAVNSNSSNASTINTTGTSSTSVNNNVSAATTSTDNTTNNNSNASSSSDTNNSSKATDKASNNSNQNKIVNQAKVATKQINFTIWILSAVIILFIIRMATIIANKKKRTGTTQL